MFNILVAEDNSDLLEITCYFLRRNGFNAIGASSGVEAMDKLDSNYVDLCIVDLMMPEMDGYEFVHELKTSNFNTNIPIIIVTAKSNFEDMEKSFNIGADDYMVKPINYDELVLRINSLLRRAKIANERKITVGSTVLDYDALTITQNGVETLLPQKEFYLLYKLLHFPNIIFTRQQIMDEIWGFDSESDEKTINVHINRLREKIKDNKDFQIVTVRGLGYKAVRTDEKGQKDAKA
ncbi:MAG: response regulator transcription factor [Clostridiales bacterium]|nr:response regulator transcription factor [Clostridiales bacterium]